MTYLPPSTDRAFALQTLLRRNELDCIRHNINVRVDEINNERSVALCTVEQRLHGPLRRSFTEQQLIGLAERALHPLQELGFIPMLNVHHIAPQLFPMPTRPWNIRSLMDWVQDLWGWAGSPLAREGFGAAPLERDPFGWKQALWVSSLRRSRLP